MKRFLIAGVLGLALLLTGCVTPQINWQARMGVYTYDQAVLDYGPPDKYARLSNGTVVAEWLTRRGEVIDVPGPYFYGPGYWWGPVGPVYTREYFPPTFLRLTFGPNGKLAAERSYAK